MGNGTSTTGHTYESVKLKLRLYHQYKIQKQLSKAIDMHFYWVRDRVKLKHFDVFWRPGVSNLGGYFTKQHLLEHQKLMRLVYLYCLNSGQDSASVCYYR